MVSEYDLALQIENDIEIFFIHFFFSFATLGVCNTQTFKPPLVFWK